MGYPILSIGVAKVNKEEARKVIDDFSNHLLLKKELILKVEVTTPEQAESIFNSLYGGEKCISADILDVAWDKSIVSKKDYDAIQTIKEPSY